MNTFLQQEDAKLDAEEARQIADWLEIVRASLNDHDAITNETREEIIYSLSTAEAALRRASAEREVSGDILALFKPH